MRKAASVFLVLALLLVFGEASRVFAQISQSLVEEYDLRSPPASLAKTVPDLILRFPVATFGALLSTSAFLVTLPVVYPAGNYLQVATPMVQNPWNYVSNRPLGVFIPEKSVMKKINEKIDDQYSEFLGRTGANGNLLNLR